MESASRQSALRDFLGLRRNVVLLLAAVILTGAGEELWMRFVPKYLEALGAGALIIALYDGLKTALAALYAYPGGVISDRWGHRRSLIGFTAVSIAGYAIMLAWPTWEAALAAMFLIVAWSNLSLPAMFTLVATDLGPRKLVMGIGVQSLIKRLPIIVGPVAGGLLLDAYGVVSGVRIGLGVSIALGLLSMILESRIRDAAGAARHSTPGFRAVVGSFSPALRRLLLSDILIRFCERIPAAWIVIYAMDQLHATGAQIGLLTALEMAIAIACYIPVAHRADRGDKAPFVMVTFIFFTLFPVALALSGSILMLAVAFAIRGMKEFGDPSRKALIVSYARADARGATVGAYYLIRDLTVSLGAIVGGLLWTISPAANFWTAAAVGVAGSLYYWRSTHTAAER
ncbi:MAG: MFS transporter [Acidobacteriia bacterium]|nr:MFS transporter [Terriglobia bacterium]